MEPVTGETEINADVRNSTSYSGRETKKRQNTITEREGLPNRHKRKKVRNIGALVVF